MPSAFGEYAMEHPGFFERAGPFPLRALVEAAGATHSGDVDLDTKIKDVRPLDAAVRGDLSFLDNPKYLSLFTHTGATACLVSPKFAGQAPAGPAALIPPEPYRDVGRNATRSRALGGKRVTIHAGASIGQDVFGFAMGRARHQKVPQIGRVIIQDDVEIGANTTIDRGALRDTVIGEGTKIDNLVQIAHNVVIGRHCVIAAQTGISGSTILEDFVAMGGQCGTVGHIRIGKGAQIGAQSGVASDIPPKERWGGYPAKPMSAWAREI